MTNNEYNRGLNDAWEFIKNFGDRMVSENEKIFGKDYYDIYSVVKRYKPLEALEKIKQHNEFKVGDIVILNRDVCGYKNAKGSKGIIEKIAFDDGIKEEKAFVSFSSGLNGWYRLRYLTNTGKHYPLIKEILAEIRGENNDRDKAL